MALPAESKLLTYELQKQALLHAHRLAVIDFCARAFSTGLDETKRAYESGELDSELPYIRICMTTPLADAVHGYTSDQEAQTNQILGNAELPIVIVAPSSYFKKFGFSPTIQAAKMGWEDFTRIWIKNGTDPLFSGTINDMTEGTITLGMQDPLQHDHIYTLPVTAPQTEAIRFYRQDSYFTHTYDAALPRSIRIPDGLTQFITPDGKLMSKREVLDYFASKDARTLDLSLHNFFTYFTSEIQHTFRSRLVELIGEPEAFLNFAENLMRSLRPTTHPETLKPLYRGKVLTRTDDFRIDVTETDTHWQIHLPNIDVSEWPLPSLTHSGAPENAGEVVIQIAKRAIHGDIHFQTWHTLPGDETRYALAEDGPGIIGLEELITLLAVMEKDIDVPTRPTQRFTNFTKRQQNK